MTINLKSNKGITTADIALALPIVILFVITTTSIFYSVFMSSQEAKRTAIGLNYAVDIFENIGSKSFSSVTPTSALSGIEGIKNISGSDTVPGTATAQIGTYNISLEIENYKDSNKIKIIKLKLEYPISTKDSETIELQRLKVIEKEEI